MSWGFPLLCCLSVFVHWAAAVTEGAVVAFANIRSDKPATFQVCKTGVHPSVCCEALDLDINDGKGYGWFRAELVAFSHIESQDTVTTIFGRHSQRPCFTDVVTSEQGGPNWRMEVPRWGAGSASVVKDPSQPGALARKYPDVINVRDVRYSASEHTSSTQIYIDEFGNIITGRRFANPAPLSNETHVDEQ